MKNRILLQLLLGLFLISSSIVHAGEGLMIYGKVQSFKNNKYVVQTPKLELTLDAKKLSTAQNKMLRLANRDSMLKFLVARTAIVSMKNKDGNFSTKSNTKVGSL